jgi:hypothetical protein
MFIVSGGYACYVHAKYNSIGETQTLQSLFTYQRFIMLTSLPREELPSQLNRAMNGILLVMVIVLAAWFHYMIFRHRIISAKFDSQNKTPSDFAFMITGLSETVTEQDIREHFTTYAPPFSNLSARWFEIREVNMCYRIDELVKLTRKLFANKTTIIALEQKLKASFDIELDREREELTKQTRDLEDQIKFIKERTYQNFTGTAIVIVSTQRGTLHH